MARLGRAYPVSRVIASPGKRPVEVEASLAVSASSDMARDVAVLHFNGSESSTTVVDSSPVGSNWVCANNARITKTAWRFGGSSLYFDGNGDYAYSPADPGLFSFGYSDFTIEFYVQFYSSAVPILFDARPYGVGGIAAPCIYATGSKLRYYINGNDRITGTTTLVNQRWYHVALSRVNGVVKLWLDGVQEGFGYNDSAVNYVASTVVIGGSAANPGANGLHGVIDELRVTSGVARYAEAFTPPTAPLPDFGGLSGMVASQALTRPVGSSLALSASASAGSPSKDAGVVGALAVSAGLSASVSKDAGVIAGFAPGGNLVFNHSFESTHPWLGGASWMSTEQARTGGYSIAVSNVDGVWAGLNLTGFSAASSEDRFWFRCWIKADSGNSGSAGTIAFAAQIRDSGQGTVGYVAPVVQCSAVSSSDWTLFTGVLNALPGAADVKFFVQLNGTPTGVIYYFDDVVVGKLEPFTASPSAGGLRNALASASRAITASPSVTSQELGVATGSLAATASPSATGFRSRDIEGGLAVTATATGSVSRVAGAAASLAAVATNAGYYGLPHGTVPPKISGAVQDYFNTKDTSKWGWTGAAGVSGGTLTIPMGPYAAITQGAGNLATGSGLVDLNESFVVAQLVTPPGNQGGAYTGLAVHNTNAGKTSEIQAWYTNGNWAFAQREFNTNPLTNITYVSYASAGSWVRIRLTAGVVYWDTSPDGVVWTSQKSDTVAGSDWWGAIIRVHGYSNDWAAGTAVWDNVNILPGQISASTTITAAPSTVGVRGCNVGASLAVTASRSGTPRYDPRAQTALAATAYTSSGMLKTHNAGASLAVSAVRSASGTEFGAADAGLAVSVAGSASMSKDASALAGFTAGGNMVHNYGFEAEEPFSGSAGYVTRSSEQSYGGGYSARMMGGGAGVYPGLNVVHIEPIPVSPDDRFYLRMRLKPHADNADVLVYMMIGAVARNSSNGLTGYPGVYIGQVLSASEWTVVQGVIAMPANTTNLQKFYIQINGMPYGTYVYVDDVVVAKLEPITVNTPTVGSRGQTMTAEPLAIESASPGAGFTDFRPGASLPVFSTQSATGWRNAPVSASRPVVVTPTGEVVEFGVGQSSLAVSASASAGMMRTRYVQASNSVGFLSVPAAVQKRLLQASLQATAVGWGAIEEVGWDAQVPADDRRAKVPAVDRTAAVSAVARLASVPADARAALTES